MAHEVLTQLSHKKLGMSPNFLKLRDTTKILWKIRYLTSWWKESFRWHDSPPSPSGRGLRCENSGEGPLLSACLTVGRVCRDGMTWDFVVQRLKMMLLSSSIQRHTPICMWYIRCIMLYHHLELFVQCSFQDLKNDGFGMYGLPKGWCIPMVSKDAWSPSQLDFRLQCTQGFARNTSIRPSFHTVKRGWCITLPPLKGRSSQTLLKAIGSWAWISEHLLFVVDPGHSPNSCNQNEKSNGETKINWGEFLIWKCLCFFYMLFTQPV